MRGIVLFLLLCALPRLAVARTNDTPTTDSLVRQARQTVEEYAEILLFIGLATADPRSEFHCPIAMYPGEKDSSFTIDPWGNLYWAYTWNRDRGRVRRTTAVALSFGPNRIQDTPLDTLKAGRFLGDDIGACRRGKDRVPANKGWR